jgi:hypothetical protein
LGTHGRVSLARSDVPVLYQRFKLTVSFDRDSFENNLG